MLKPLFWLFFTGIAKAVGLVRHVFMAKASVLASVDAARSGRAGIATCAEGPWAMGANIAFNTHPLAYALSFKYTSPAESPQLNGCLPISFLARGTESKDSNDSR